MRRKSIELQGFGHGDQPIPAASRIGPLLTTGGVHGVDRLSGALPSEAAEQIQHMFGNLAAVLAAGGATLDDVARMTIYLRSPDLRPMVNVHWLKAFPEQACRPARHVMINPNLPPNMHVQCDAIAYVALR